MIVSADAESRIPVWKAVGNPRFGAPNMSAAATKEEELGPRSHASAWRWGSPLKRASVFILRLWRQSNAKPWRVSVEAMALTQEALSTEPWASSAEECRSDERVVGGEGRNRPLKPLNPSHLGPVWRTFQQSSATPRWCPSWCPPFRLGFSATLTHPIPSRVRYAPDRLRCWD